MKYLADLHTDHLKASVTACHQMITISGLFVIMVSEICHHFQLVCLKNCERAVTNYNYYTSQWSRCTASFEGIPLDATRTSTLRWWVYNHRSNFEVSLQEDLKSTLTLSLRNKISQRPNTLPERFLSKKNFVSVYWTVGHVIQLKRQFRTVAPLFRSDFGIIHYYFRKE